MIAFEKDYRHKLLLRHKTVINDLKFFLSLKSELLHESHNCMVATEFFRNTFYLSNLKCSSVQVGIKNLPRFYIIIKIPPA